MFFLKTFAADLLYVGKGLNNTVNVRMRREFCFNSYKKYILLYVSEVCTMIYIETINIENKYCVQQATVRAA